ncbi:hypothetical protein HYH02_010222 [Chlamydomonas schloesseri]|uniref:Uncharacterized protein n=1 Tax=Chlamydomonas schloesseri TaxID=2026947 RepID=A0A835TCD2_9CHLO|nr:hypothetical protein HYH02_010222 [Chlamydomonas schloesseri]|eukprot:KAG2440643.1 hypothetical protein HYH02_010222 [Chlamydomonas schloesseri]
MSAAADSPPGALPQPAPGRVLLRTTSNRTSLGSGGGVFSPMVSPKCLQRSAALSSATSFARVSANGTSSGISPGNSGQPPSGALAQLGSGGTGGGGTGDLPRLPRTSESGAERSSRNSPSGPSSGLRRSTTMTGVPRDAAAVPSLGVSLPVKEGIGSPSLGSSGGGPSPGLGGGENVLMVKRDRNALLQEKTLLLGNKRRLEAAIRTLLEQQAAEDGTTWGAGLAGDGASGGGGGPGSPMPAIGGGTRPQLARVAGGVKSMLSKVLEESAALDKQIAVNGSAGAVMLANADMDARVRDLTARIAELQMDHEVALSRLEGELKYRNTQSAAATSSLQKQLGEAEDELSRVRRQLAVAEGRVREYYDQNTELRRQVFELHTTLGDRNQALADAKTAMGTDKATLQTVNDMLKTQLREAAADQNAKSARIAELERQLVHRETLLAEARSFGGHSNGRRSSSSSGTLPAPAVPHVGGGKSSSIPGGLCLGPSALVSLPIGMSPMSPTYYRSGTGTGTGAPGEGGSSGAYDGLGAPVRLAPLPPPEPKDVWGNVSPVLAAVGARSHTPAGSGPNSANAIAPSSSQAAAPRLVLVNSFTKGSGSGSAAPTVATGSKFGNGRGPAAGSRGALAPHATEGAKSHGLSSGYSEDFSDSEPGDARNYD